VGWLGAGVQSLEPIAWAEELIESARVADHPRLAFLYVVASWCYMTGRIEAAVRYCEAGQIVLGRSRDALPYGIEGFLGAVYLTGASPQPHEACRWSPLLWGLRAAGEDRDRRAGTVYEPS
jgi:hypothetical protein